MMYIEIYIHSICYSFFTFMMQVEMRPHKEILFSLMHPRTGLPIVIYFFLIFLNK